MILGMFGAMSAFAMSTRGNSITFVAGRTDGGTLGNAPAANQTFHVTFGFADIVTPRTGMTGSAVYWAFDPAHVIFDGLVENHDSADFSFIQSGDAGQPLLRVGSSGTQTADRDQITVRFRLTALGALQENIAVWLHIHDGWPYSGATELFFQSADVYYGGFAAMGNSAHDFFAAATAPTLANPTLIPLAGPAVDELLRDINEAADVPPNRDDLEDLIRDNWEAPGLGLNPDHLDRLNELDPDGDFWDEILDAVIAGRVPGEYPTRDAVRDVINSVVREILGLTAGERIQFHITEMPSNLIAPLSDWPSLIDFGLENANVSVGGQYSMTVWLQGFEDMYTLSIPIEFDPTVVRIDSIDVGPAFGAGLTGLHAPYFAGLVGIGDNWDIGTINPAGRFFLTLEVLPGHDGITVGEMMTANPAIHQFFTVEFTVLPGAADAATSNDEIVLFRQGAMRNYDDEDHGSGSLFGVEGTGTTPAGARYTGIGGFYSGSPGTDFWGSAPVVFPTISFEGVPTIEIMDGTNIVTGLTSTHNLETATAPLIRTTFVTPPNEPTTSRLYRNGVLVPNPAVYNITVTPDGTFTFPLNAAEGSYEIVSRITSTGEEANHFVNVIDTTITVVRIGGTAQLFGKTRSNIVNAAGETVWNFTANRNFIDMGIQVELINTATGDVIAGPVTTFAANTTGAFAELERNFELVVNADNDVLALLQTNGGTTLRFSRWGSETISRANPAGVVNNDFVRDDRHLTTEVRLNGASATIVDGARINMTRAVVLYAGAFRNDDAVDMGDLALIRMLIGSTDPSFSRFNINEYWGVNAGDLNSVSRSVLGHERNEQPARANYAFTVTP